MVEAVREGLATGPVGVDDSLLVVTASGQASRDDAKAVAVLALAVERAADVVLNELVALVEQVFGRERAEVRGRAARAATGSTEDELGHRNGLSSGCARILMDFRQRVNFPVGKLVLVNT